MSLLPACFRCFRIWGGVKLTPLFPGVNSSPAFHETLSIQQRRWKANDRRALIDSMPLRDTGTQGEKSLDIDVMSAPKETLFPDEDTPNQLFHGIKFSDIPICHIKVSKNNTILHLTDTVGNKIAYRSCGQEGFKNTRKGTNIAAQTTALALANLAKEQSVAAIKIVIQGLGPGRMSAVKGLQMGGMKIVAIADATPISWHPPRARKARRL